MTLYNGMIGAFALVVVGFSSLGNMAQAVSDGAQDNFCRAYQMLPSVSGDAETAAQKCLEEHSPAFSKFLGRWASWTGIDKAFAIKSPCFSVWCSKPSNIGSCNWKIVQRCTEASIEMMRDLIRNNLFPTPSEAPLLYPLDDKVLQRGK